jgi:hypothetical protein
MRNLILKDLVLHKKFLAVISLLYIAYMGIFGSRINSPRIFFLFSMIMSGIIPVLIFTREDKFKALSMTCSLPVSRRQIVLARYVLGWLLTLIIEVLMAGAVLLFPGSKLGPSDLLNLNMFVFALAMMTAILSILMPLLIRFGIAGIFVVAIGAQVLGIIVLSFRFKWENILVALIAAMKSVFAFLSAGVDDPGRLALVLAMICLVNLASIKCSEFLFRRKDV